MSSNHYSEKNIKTLDTIAAIRLRPAMYIDGIGEAGLYKKDSEVVQNAFDEFLIGAATKCVVTYDSSRGYMSVLDDGRGIPIGKLEDIFTKAHTGGKFDRNSYKISSGQNGIGSKAANALSVWCRVEVWRTGYNDENGDWVKPKHGWIVFEKGRKVDQFEEDLPEDSTRHGTLVEYITDVSIMKTHVRNVKRFKEYLNTVSYIDPGILIEYIVDGVKHKYQHFGGLPEFLNDFVKSKKIKLLTDPIEISGMDPSPEDAFSYDIIFSYHVDNTGDTNIISFVNGNRTISHGNHVTGFRAGCALALTQYISENDMVPKSLKNLNVSGTLISNNIVAIVGVRHKDPLYSGQTKESLNSEEVTEPVKQATRTTFAKWLRSNPQKAKKLVDLVLDFAKYEDDRKKLKDTLIKSKAVKSAFAANGVDPKKFYGCSSKNPEDRELFIVEGESASGNINKCKDQNTQAMFLLTGKIMNMARTSKNNISSKVILDLIQILGMGIPNDHDIRKCNYGKILITTDADDDGAHIVTLLLAFFYICYPGLIEEGRVYISQPPIKRVTLANKSSFYLHTEKDYKRMMDKFTINTFNLYSEKTNKKLSDGAFNYFLDKLEGYLELIDNHAQNLIIGPELLELIVVHINDLCNKNYVEFEKRGFTVTRVSATHFDFDSNIRHTFIDLDNNFIDGAYAEIFDKLKQLNYYGFYLKGIRSEVEYHGSIYELLTIINGILGSKVKIKRYKGLGEMEEPELNETVVNPATRFLTRVTFNDAEKAKFAIDTFMGNGNPEFKQDFYAGIEQFK